MIRILKYSDVDANEVFARVEPKMDVSGIVSDILASVKRDGDAALFAAITLAKQEENAGKTIVALLPDSGDRYYSTALFQEQ